MRATLFSLVVVGGATLVSFFFYFLILAASYFPPCCVVFILRGAWYNIPHWCASKKPFLCIDYIYWLLIFFPPSCILCDWKRAVQVQPLSPRGLSVSCAAIEMCISSALCSRRSRNNSLSLTLCKAHETLSQKFWTKTSCSRLDLMGWFISDLIVTKCVFCV